MADIDFHTDDSATTSESASAHRFSNKRKLKNRPSKQLHPSTAEMVNNAIKVLKERGGSSLQAIKKYVAANYTVDVARVAPFIIRYLKSAVASGSLVQTKGKGAVGSFKLASSISRSTSSKQKTTASRQTVSSTKKSPVSKASKRASAAKAKGSSSAADAEKKAAASASSSKPKSKSPSKVRKSRRAGPSKKSKAVKPKAAKGRKVSSPKRRK